MDLLGRPHRSTALLVLLVHHQTLAQALSLVSPSRSTSPHPARFTASIPFPTCSASFFFSLDGQTGFIFDSVRCNSVAASSRHYTYPCPAQKKGLNAPTTAISRASDLQPQFSLPNVSDAFSFDSTLPDYIRTVNRLHRNAGGRQRQARPPGP